jgi:hypothetical protein
MSNVPGLRLSGHLTYERVSNPAKTNRSKTAYRVEEGPKNVQKPLEEDPVQSHAVVEGPVPVYDKAMADGDHARQAKADEHHRTKWSVMRRPELLSPADNPTTEAQHEDLLQISL